MSADRMNIYSRYRRAAGLTQERAAELLDCGVRTLASWESGPTMPPDDKALLMCDVYAAPTLAIEHLRLSSSLAKQILPEVKAKPLAQAVLHLLTSIRAFNASESDWTLMEIAEDGQIGEDERKHFERLIGQLEDIVEAAYELKLSKEAQR